MTKLKRRKKKKVVLKRRVKKKLDQLEQWFKIIEKTTLAWYGVIENAECLKCGGVAKAMIRTGSLRFCMNCFQEEFDANSETRDKDAYYKWMEYEHKRWEEELL